MRIGRAQNSRFGSTMHARGVSSVWESAGFASRRSPVRSRYAPPLEAPLMGGFLLPARTRLRRHPGCDNAEKGGLPAGRTQSAARSV